MKNNYTTNEWLLISQLPQLTGLLMSSAVYSGIEGTKQELTASLKSIADGLLKYPDNEFVASLIPSAVSKSELMVLLKQQQQQIIDQIGVLDETTTHHFQQSTLAMYEKVLHYIVKKQTYLAVVEFKRWLLYIAEQVAVAAIEVSDTKVDSVKHSQEKHDLYKQIQERLEQQIVF